MNLLQKCPAVVLSCPAAELIGPVAILSYNNFVHDLKKCFEKFKNS